MAKSAHPDYEDVMRFIRGMDAQIPNVRVLPLGHSVKGREIPCVIFGDAGAGNGDKQRALIVAGQHGNEESGRAIALALMRFLLSDASSARDLLRLQEVAVVPCGNPDGAQADSYHNADDVNSAHDYHFDRAPQAPESAALEKFALSFEPDCFVDIHGLSGGSMNDRIWVTPVLGFSANRGFVFRMAEEASEAAEAAGYPVCEVQPAPIIDPARSATGLLGEKLAFEMNTLAFGLEAIERYYREQEWCEVGLLRLLTLLEYGGNDRFGLGYTGYPNSLVSGFRLCGLLAHGQTAELRRQSRGELTRFLRENFAMVSRGSDGVERLAKVGVFSKTVNGKNPERFSIMVRVKKPATLETVIWDGKPLASGGEHGFRVLDRIHDLQITADICAPFGGPLRSLEIRYRSPMIDIGGRK